MSKKLRHGCYLQIPLPMGLGYAYAQYIDLTKVVHKPSLPDLIRVLDFKTETEEYFPADLKQSDYLIAPLFVSGLPPTVRKGIWKVLFETFPVEDFVIPHFSRHEDWVSDDDWYYCLDASSSKKVKTSYANVKHLSPLSADGTGVIEIEISMTFLIKEGKNVEDYFELKEYYESSTYEKVQATPPYYSLLSNSRDRVLDVAKQ